MTRWLADVVALACLLTMNCMSSLVLPGDRWDRLLAIAGVLLLEVPLCMYLLYGDKAPRMSAAEWLGAALGSVLFGAVLFATDMWLGWRRSPDLPAVAAAMNSGPGLLMTIAVCPVGTFVCLASAVRAFVQKQPPSEYPRTEQP